MSQLRADFLDRQRRCVRRKNRILGNVLLDLTEDRLLDADLFEDGLDDEVAICIEALVGGSGDEAAELVGAVPVEATLGLELADLVMDVCHALVDARLVEVGDQHRHL